MYSDTRIDYVAATPETGQLFATHQEEYNHGDNMISHCSRQPFACTYWRQILRACHLSSKKTGLKMYND